MGLELKTTHKELDFILGARCMEPSGTLGPGTTGTSDRREGERVNHSRCTRLEREHVGIESAHVES